MVEKLIVIALSFIARKDPARRILRQVVVRQTIRRMQDRRDQN